MSWFNTSQRFGILVKTAHWATASLFLAQFFLVYRRDYFPENAPEKLQYILLHKSFGVVLMALAIIFVIVRHLGTRPKWPSMPLHEKILAKIVHIGLWICMLLMPISGFLMSAYSGYGVKLFGYPLPTWVTADKALSGWWHGLHVNVSYAVIALVVLHTIGALTHHFIKGDNILKRMLPFCR